MERKLVLGDFVENEYGDIGIVEWVENRAMNIKVEDGYVGINLLTGSKGFQAPVREDKCIKSSLKKLCEKFYAEKKEAEKRLHNYNFDRRQLEKLEKENSLLKQLLEVYLK